MDLDRRKFFDYSVKAIAMTYLSMINLFPKVNLSEDKKKLPWKSKTFKFPLENFKLQSGETLNNAFLLVDVNGELNSSKSNAIIFATCFAGSHKFNQMAYGIDRALNPLKYCIITPNLFCSGHSSSPSNTAPTQDGPRFPSISYYDNINAQDKLISEYFGITNPLMYIGFSMGAQQAFHWGALHGDKTGGIIPLCGTAKTTTQNWITLEGCKLALQSDVNYNNGDYISPPKKGLKAFSRNYTSTLFDKEGYEEGLHLNLFDGFEDTESYLNYMDAFFGSIDANDLLGMLNTWQMGDIGKHQKFNNNTKEALANINCPALVMPSSTDLSFPARNNIPEVSEMSDAELVIINTKHGHLAGGMSTALTSQEDVTFIDKNIKEFLKKIT
tara:strand:- start:102 stop:1256 length:1155 start_codon:yes stop_codon:yes gene_type:complete